MRVALHLWNIYVAIAAILLAGGSTYQTRVNANEEYLRALGQKVDAWRHMQNVIPMNETMSGEGRAQLALERRLSAVRWNAGPADLEHYGRDKSGREVSPTRAPLEGNNRVQISEN